MFGHRNARPEASETSDYEDPVTEPVKVDLFSPRTVQVVSTGNAPAVSSGFLAPIDLGDVTTATSRKISDVIAPPGGVFSSLP